MIRISPSLLAADFSNLEREVASVSHADYLHVDVMDGVFVPNIAIGLPTTAALARISDIPLDVHLMITRPQNYVSAFAKAGAEIISFHAESDCEIAECIGKIRSEGKKPALAINPDTDADVVLPYLKDLFMVLVMTVQPGFGGQTCREECFEKVRILRERANALGLDLRIEVDGGITPENAPRAVAAGADVLVAGSAVFKAKDRNAAIDALKGI